jgi:hypothetical protein
MVAIPGSLFRQSKLESIQSALACQSAATIALTASVGARRVALTAARRQQRIAAQLVMIIEIFVPKSQTEDPLPEQILYGVLNPLGSSVIIEAGGKPLDEIQALIDLPKQQGATVRADPTTIKRGDDFAPTRTLKEESLSGTVCH